MTQNTRMVVLESATPRDLHCTLCFVLPIEGLGGFDSIRQQLTPYGLDAAQLALVNVRIDRNGQRRDEWRAC
jgi:hypothetical protein